VTLASRWTHTHSKKAKMSTNTEREIKLAIARIRHGKQKRTSADRKFSIASVAAEAGVSNATIHNRYPQLAEHIRKIQKADAKGTTEKKQTEISELKRQIAELRNQLEERDSELRKIAIVNLRLSQEMKGLKSTKRSGAKSTPNNVVDIVSPTSKA